MALLRRFNGVRMPVHAMIAHFGGEGVNIRTVRDRLQRGWAMEEAVTLRNVGHGGGAHPDRRTIAQTVEPCFNASSTGGHHEHTSQP